MKESNMRARIYMIVLILIICCITGCTIENENNKDLSIEKKADIGYYDTSTGCIYSELSDIFDIKVLTWKIYFDEKDIERISLNLLIKNKSNTKIENLDCIISFNDEARNLFASGITVYDKFEPAHLVPEITANGSGYSIRSTVESVDRLKEMNVEKSDLLQKVREVKIELTWNDGGEIIDICLDKLS